MITYINKNGVRVDPMGQPAPEPEPTAGAASGPTNDQLKAQLDALGVKYPANARKADLQALLEEAEQQVEGESEASGNEDSNPEGNDGEGADDDGEPEGQQD